MNGPGAEALDGAALTAGVPAGAVGAPGAELVLAGALAPAAVGERVEVQPRAPGGERGEDDQEQLEVVAHRGVLTSCGCVRRRRGLRGSRRARRRGIRPGSPRARRRRGRRGSRRRGRCGTAGRRTARSPGRGMCWWSCWPFPDPMGSPPPGGPGRCRDPRPRTSAGVRSRQVAADGGIVQVSRRSRSRDPGAHRDPRGLDVGAAAALQRPAGHLHVHARARRARGTGRSAASPAASAHRSGNRAASRSASTGHCRPGRRRTLEHVGQDVPRRRFASPGRHARQRPGALAQRPGGGQDPLGVLPVGEVGPDGRDGVRGAAQDPDALVLRQQRGVSRPSE